MKLKLYTFILGISYFLIFSSCLKKDSSLLTDSPNSKKELIIDRDILDGTYSGKISLDRIVWTGTVQKPNTSWSYPLNFIIKGNQFSRAECGLYGYIEINKEKETVEFKTKGGANTYYRNWIIDTFKYKIDAGVITISKTEPKPTNAFLASTYGIGSQIATVSISASNYSLPK